MTTVVSVSASQEACQEVHTCENRQNNTLSSYIRWYPVLRTAQSASHLTPPLPRQTCSFQHQLDFSGKHSAMLQLPRRLFTYVQHCPLLGTQPCEWDNFVWTKWPMLQTGTKKIWTQLLLTESGTLTTVPHQSNTENPFTSTHLPPLDEPT